MSQLQSRKAALTAQRDTLRQTVATQPTNAAAADQLRQTESELATVDAQINYGPGARAMVNQAIGLAAAAARRPQRRSETPTATQSAPTPAPLPTPQRDAPRYSFADESDVPWPQRNANGLPVAPMQSAAPNTPPNANAQPDAETQGQTPRRFSFQGENDVPWPQAKPAAANAIFRGNNG